MGLTLIKLKNYSDAIKMFDKSIEYKENNYAAYNNKGR